MQDFKDIFFTYKIGMEYSYSIWADASETTLEKLDSVQARATKVIVEVVFSSNNLQIVKKYSLDGFEKRRRYDLIKFTNRSPEYGTAGRLSITRESPILQHQPRNGTLSSNSKQSDQNSEDGIIKRNSWTVKDRALPEIPYSTVTPALSHASAADNGENIPNTVEHTKVKSHNKAQAPKPPGNDPSKVFPMNGSVPFPVPDTSSVVTVTITVNDKTQIIGNNASLSDKASKSRVPVVDSLPGASNSMVVLKKVEKVENPDSSVKPGPSTENNFYDIVPDNPSDKNSQSTSMSSSPGEIFLMSSYNIIISISLFVMQHYY
ncbi:uncharacterized protein TNCV_3905781 [Trichonephila clavipes]|nr:uncharacterized protein TNCV_3905781 [Trichonephila clavipes]